MKTAFLLSQQDHLGGSTVRPRGLASHEEVSGCEHTLSESRQQVVGSVFTLGRGVDRHPGGPPAAHTDPEGGEEEPTRGPSWFPISQGSACLGPAVGRATTTSRTQLCLTGCPAETQEDGREGCSAAQRTVAASRLSPHQPFRNPGPGQYDPQGS